MLLLFDEPYYLSVVVYVAAALSAIFPKSQETKHFEIPSTARKHRSLDNDGRAIVYDNSHQSRILSDVIGGIRIIIDRLFIRFINIAMSARAEKIFQAHIGLEAVALTSLVVYSLKRSVTPNFFL